MILGNCLFGRCQVGVEIVSVVRGRVGQFEELRVALDHAEYSADPVAVGRLCPPARFLTDAVRFFDLFSAGGSGVGMHERTEVRQFSGENGGLG